MHQTVETARPTIALILLRRECGRSVCPPVRRHLANLCPETPQLRHFNPPCAAIHTNPVYHLIAVNCVVVPQPSPCFDST